MGGFVRLNRHRSDESRNQQDQSYGDECVKNNPHRLRNGDPRPFYESNDRPNNDTGDGDINEQPEQSGDAWSNDSGRENESLHSH